MNRAILIKYKQIKTAYTKLIHEAKYRHNWDTEKFMNVISGLFVRQEKELERYLERHAKN